MKPWVVLVALAFGLTAASVSYSDQARTETAPRSPHWLGASLREGGTPGLQVPVKFERTFNADKAVQQATIKFANDFCFATVSLSGTAVLDIAPFCQTQTLEVTEWMKRGENSISVECREMNQLSAMAFSLELRWIDGTTTMLVSDPEWKVTSALPGESITLDDRGEVAPELWGIGRRDISLSAYENYEQWQQSKGEVADKNRPKFWLAPGFEITEVRIAQPDEGSWIAMAFDDRGRLTISREDVGLLRMTLAEDRKSVSRVEKIDVPLEECRGLAYDGQTLYANANNSKALFRLKIDDDGKPQELEKLCEFPGGVGHGRNDLSVTKHQNGNISIQSIHGDSVELPHQLEDDYRSPFNETKRVPPKKEGALVNVFVRGNQVERRLVHAGLRNPYGISSNGLSWFTFDADNEHDMGTPWYRPTRILHLIPGGDSGYREVTGQLPPRLHDQPDHAPPLYDIGRSSPTSVMFGYDLRFPVTYQRALFALDWTYGRVIAVHLAPRGMTYRANAETFLQGRPLNVTDIATGPDGAMYLITGGRKTQSTLYRIQAKKPETEETGSNEASHEQSCRKATGIRITRFGYLPDPPYDASLLQLQWSHNPVKRHSDMLKLEEELQINSPHIANMDGNLLALCLARSRSPMNAAKSLNWITGNVPVSLTDQFIWVRIISLCLETSRDQVLAQRDKLIPQVVAEWHALEARPYSVAPEGTSVELRRRLAYLLGELGVDELPKLAAEKLLASAVQEDQIAGLLALRNQKTGWTLELRRQQFATINSIPLMIGGAGLPPLEKWLREESIKTLTEDEKAALGDLLQPRPPEPEPLPAPRRLVQKWALEDLSSIHAGDGQRGDAQRGQLLFREALCSRCHRVGIRGAAVGPDLTHVSRRFSRRDILESVLTPSLSVAENYRQETITTRSGQVFTGRIIPEGDYRSEKIRLSLDPLDASKVAEIDKKEIEEHAPAATSPMPSGLLDTLTIDQIADLLAYLESGGGGK